MHPSRCKAIASAPLKNDKGRRRDLGTACPAPVAVDSPIDSRDLVSLANVRIVELSRACCQHWLSQSRIRKLSRPPQAVAGDRALSAPRNSARAEPPLCSLIKVGWLIVKGCPKDRSVAGDQLAGVKRAGLARAGYATMREA